MTPSTSFRAALFAITLLTLGQTATASETVIQNFGTAPDGTALSTPLVADASGNLYGAAAQGGKYGQGVVYELSPPAATGTSWTETTIYSFPPSKGIAQPQGALVKGSNGVLWHRNSGRQLRCIPIDPTSRRTDRLDRDRSLSFYRTE